MQTALQERWFRRHVIRFQETAFPKCCETQGGLRCDTTYRALEADCISAINEHHGSIVKLIQSPRRKFIGGVNESDPQVAGIGHGYRELQHACVSASLTEFVHEIGVVPVHDFADFTVVLRVDAQAVIRTFRTDAQRLRQGRLTFRGLVIGQAGRENDADIEPNSTRICRVGKLRISATEFRPPYCHR